MVWDDTCSNDFANPYELKGVSLCRIRRPCFVVPTKHIQCRSSLTVDASSYMEGSNWSSTEHVNHAIGLPAIRSIPGKLWFDEKSQ